MEDRYVFLFEEVQVMAKGNDSKYRNVQKCRDDLLEFLDVNEWFGMSKRGADKNIEVIITDKALSSLELWINAYGRPADEKVKILFDTYRMKFPNTCKHLKEYFGRNSLLDKRCGCQILNFLFFTIKDDSELFVDESAKRLLEKAESELSSVGTGHIAKFISELDKSGLSWQYKIEPRKPKDIKIEAYNITDFSVMAYCVFNEAHWKKQGMIKKAVMEKRCADMWIFVALHFVCGVRRTDMIHMPVPVLIESKTVIRNRLLAGDADKDALQVVDDWVYRMRFLRSKPSKTASYTDIPELKVFIPESLRKPFGIILLTVLLHHEEDTPLFEIVNEYNKLKSFFGNEFMKACGESRFVTRSATKAYLQGIEAIGDDGCSARGYILAALARSHKGSIGSFPEITDVYLRDENFSGYKAEFILREMFERGIFGFIPVMLLRSFEEEKFLSLSVSDQTKLIKVIGLDAGQIEDITGLVDRALLNVRECTGLLFQNGVAEKKAVETILTRMVGDHSPAKNPEYICLRIAAKDRCINTDRTSCLGCGYEVYTKAAFYNIVKEYRLLNKKRKIASDSDAERYRQIIKNVIIPSIQEILLSMKVMYPDADNDILLDILEGGMQE